MMQIQIHYKCKSRSLPQVITLRPTEYFAALELGETYERDGVPKFDHARDYLDVSAEELEWTELQIRGTNQDQIRRTEVYSNGLSVMVHGIDTEGFEEIIIETSISELAVHKVHIYRKAESKWMMILNSVVESQPDGSEIENRIFPGERKQLSFTE